MFVASVTYIVSINVKFGLLGFQLKPKNYVFKFIFTALVGLKRVCIW